MQQSFLRSNLLSETGLKLGFALSFEKRKPPHKVVFTFPLGACACTIENLVLPDLKQEFCLLRGINSPLFIWLLSLCMKPVLLVFENKYSLGMK